MRKLIVGLSILSTAVLLLCASGLIYASFLTPVEPAVVSIPLNADTIYRLVNKERTEAGLKPLVRDSRLDASAQTKADDMVAKNYFAHYNPVTNEFAGNDYKMNPGLCSYASENINQIGGIGDYNATAVNSWMNSKPHHDAILKADYTLTGIAVNGDKVVQHFCVAK